MFYVLIFTAAMMVKGGWLGKMSFWNEWKADRAEKMSGHIIPKLFAKVADVALDEKILSALIVLIGLLAAQPDAELAIYTAFVWSIIIRVSMGEEAGGIGDYKENWGDYVQWLGPKKGRSFAIKKGLQYGGFFGGALACVYWSPWLFVAGLAFPLVYFIGSSLYRLIHKSPSWAYAEPLWGALIGLAWGLG